MRASTIRAAVVLISCHDQPCLIICLQSDSDCMLQHWSLMCEHQTCLMWGRTNYLGKA